MKDPDLLSDTPDPSREMLKKYTAQARANLSAFIETHGVTLPILAAAMSNCIRTLPSLPDGAACKTGCSYCCHLRVGISIPEAVILYDQLKSQTTPEGFDFFRQRLSQAAQKGDTLREDFWRTTQSACPFLDKKETATCLIYELRPFSCRAYHSTDSKVCRQGFEKGMALSIPCFTLYRAFTEMYVTVFIQVMAEKGCFSYQVGLVKALQLLFEDETRIDAWIQGKDVFIMAKIE